MKNVGLKVSWTDLLLLQMVLVSLQRRVQLQATSTQIVNSNYVCLVQWFPTGVPRHPGVPFTVPRGAVG